MYGNSTQIHRDLVNQNQGLIDVVQWLCFKTNGVNFDNYQN